MIQMKNKKKDDQRKTAHKNVVTRKYIIINCDKYIYNFWMSFSMFTFCSAITYGDVSYDYMPQTFATSKEQRNNFAVDKENGKYI